jgi:seryl-tRNA synthetase
MLDIKIIRDKPEMVKEIIQKRNLKLNLDDFLLLDNQRGELIIKIDELREIRNKVSKEIPTLPNDQKHDKIVEMKQV